MFSNAKVGDIIWHHTTNAYHTVGAVDIHAIRVGCVWYNIDGTNKDGAQILFWDKPSIVAPPQPPRMVKRWIRGRYTTEGKVFMSGIGEYPTLFLSKEEAEKSDAYCGLPIAFIVEVEVEER